MTAISIASHTSALLAWIPNSSGVNLNKDKRDMKRLLSKPSAASCLEVRKDHYFEKNAARRATLPATNAIKDNSKTFSAELHQRSFT